MFELFWGFLVMSAKRFQPNLIVCTYLKVEWDTFIRCGKSSEKESNEKKNIAHGIIKIVLKKIDTFFLKFLSSFHTVMFYEILFEKKYEKN